jgi:hypothetical protein
MPILIVNADFEKDKASFAIPSTVAFLLVDTVIRGRSQNIHIYVDGKEIAAIETNGRIETTITAGTHTIQAKYQNLSTLEYSFEISDNEYTKMIFCVGNSNFRQKMNITLVIVFLSLLLFAFILSYFPKINLGLLFLPVIGMVVYNIIAIKQHWVIDITEMWSEYA